MKATCTDCIMAGVRKYVTKKRLLSYDLEGPEKTREVQCQAELFSQSLQWLLACWLIDAAWQLFNCEQPEFKHHVYTFLHNAVCHASSSILDQKILGSTVECSVAANVGKCTSKGCQGREGQV